MAQKLPPIINLTKTGAPQPVQGQRVPQPPMDAVPPDLRGNGVPSKGPAQNVPLHGHQVMPMPIPQHHFPQPPPQAVPHDLRPQGPPAMNRVEISDLRSERMTPAEAREILSEIKIIRLEKMENPHEVDDEGYPMPSSWDRVKRIPITDISQEEAKRQVRALMRTGKPVAEKKADLGLRVQRQLEIALESLARADTDKRYCYKLVQFDSKLRPYRHDEFEYIAKPARKSKSHKYPHTSKKHKKPKWERVAVTAYFKRTPTPEQDSMRLLQERQRERSARPVPGQQRLAIAPPMQAPSMQTPAHMAPPAFNQHPSPNHFPPAMPQRQQPVAMGQAAPPKQQQPMMKQETSDFPRPPPGMQPKQMPKQPIPPPGTAPKDLASKGMPPQGRGVPPLNVPPQKNDSQKRPQIIIEEDAPKQMKQTFAPAKQGGQGRNLNNGHKPVDFVIKTVQRHASPRSSQSSFESSSSSISEASTPLTSLSSSSGTSHHKRGRSRTPVYRTDPANFGVVMPSMPARRHSKNEEREYLIEDVSYLPQRHQNLPPVPRPASRVATRDSPYPGVHERHIAYNSRTAPPPRIVQTPAIRRVTPEEARRQVLQDDLKQTEDRIYRLRLDAAYREENLHLDEKRLDRLGEELRHRKNLLSELHEIPWPEKDAAEYMDIRGRQRSLELALPRERHGILKRK